MQVRLLPTLQLTSLCAVCACSSVSTSRGRFIDEFNNEISFRGVNVVYKDPPYYPSVELFHPDLSFVQDDVDLLKSFGVNLIR